MIERGQDARLEAFMHDILAGYDGSVSAQAAIRFAKNLAAMEGARLHILTVARLPDWGKRAYERPELLETEKRHCQTSSPGSRDSSGHPESLSNMR